MKTTVKEIEEYTGKLTMTLAEKAFKLLTEHRQVYLVYGDGFADITVENENRLPIDSSITWENSRELIIRHLAKRLRKLPVIPAHLRF